MNPLQKYLPGTVLTLALTATLSAGLVIGPVHAATSAKTPTTTKPAAAKRSTNPLPVMNVTDVKTGKAFPLASSLDGKRPLLVWFWAPH